VLRTRYTLQRHIPKYLLPPSRPHLLISPFSYGLINGLIHWFSNEITILIIQSHLNSATSCGTSLQYMSLLGDTSYPNRNTPLHPKFYFNHVQKPLFKPLQ
jgi:hypothetical protein